MGITRCKLDPVFNKKLRDNGLVLVRLNPPSFRVAATIKPDNRVLPFVGCYVSLSLTWEGK